MVPISNKDAETLLSLLNVTPPAASSLREYNRWRRAMVALKRLKRKLGD